jgi:hypothetical protein
LRAAELESAAFDAVAGFLNGASGLENEVQWRRSISAYTEGSLVRKIESVEKRQQEEEDAEA